MDSVIIYVRDAVVEGNALAQALTKHYPHASFESFATSTHPSGQPSVETDCRERVELSRMRAFAQGFLTALRQSRGDPT